MEMPIEILIEIALSHCNILQLFSYHHFSRGIASRIGRYFRYKLTLPPGDFNGTAESSFYRAQNDNDKLVIIVPIPRDILTGEHPPGEIASWRVTLWNSM